ncbi:SDR family NAD(P)-dependent oxidoreductase [Oscillatoria sp. FACHB-1407]|uniref:SDR family NAD(P)-dependent oxidoreductase n=1 Tax=Oscillatoria sp. FACHB-1407 TaxID=2692847 RepID=UPI00168A0230|nr:SDR family NAD(P)-dependent oxidoreductase [Oscillatoria sp. FACHB-1407]MBD2465744.1 SDR family NAD(P)-dependent oxidoreductase [Oscillatoria sp. FACHB-1407]
MALKSAGFITYATARNPQTLSDLVAKGCHVLQLDLTSEASMLAAVRSIEAKHGAISVLVNNAGYNQIGPLEELTMEEIRCQFETNVFGLLRMCQLVLPGMRSQGYGRIINVGSIGGTFTTPGNGAYHASKYAVESFTDALRYEVQPFGVEVILIQPTGVRTPFVEKLYALMPQTGSDSPYAAFKQNIEAQVQQMFGGNAWGILTPEDVAQVIVQASLVRRPQTRYKVGLGGKIFFWVRRLLPDRAWDALMSRMFPMGEVSGSKTHRKAAPIKDFNAMN